MVRFTSVSTPHHVYALRNPGSDGAHGTKSVSVTSHENGKAILHAFVRQEDAEAWADAYQARSGSRVIPERVHLRDLSHAIDIARCVHPDGSSVYISLHSLRETPY